MVHIKKVIKIKKKADSIDLPTESWDREWEGDSSNRFKREAKFRSY